MAKKASELVPTNWCDPLLTGPGAVIGTNPDCQGIERLLRGIKLRIESWEIAQESRRRQRKGGR